MPIEEVLLQKSLWNVKEHYNVVSVIFEVSFWLESEDK